MPRLSLTLLVLLLTAGPVLAEDAAPGEAAVRAALAHLDGSEAGRTKARSALRRVLTRHTGALLAAAERHPEGTEAGDTLRGVLERAGPKPLQRHLEGELARDGSSATRLRVLGRLARFGGPDHMDFAVQVVRGVDPAWLPTPRVGKAWLAAWRRVSAEGPTRSELRRALADVPGPLRKRSVALLAGRKDPEALGAVVDVARGDVEASAPLLTALARLDALALYRAGAAEAVLAGLGARDPAVVRAAAALAPRSRSRAAVPLLVDALERDDPALTRSVLRALRSLTVAAVGKDAPTWRRWMAAEATWADRVDLADDQEAGALTRAMRELVRRPYMGATFAPELARLLRHENAGVAAMAAAALGRLGRLDVAMDLARALDDADARVSGAAHAALVQLTGRNLDATTAAWRRALGA